MGYLAVVFASVIGAINLCLLKYSVGVISPVLTMFIRFAIAFCCLVILLFILKTNLRKFFVKELIIVAILNTVTLYFIVLGLHKTTVSHVQIIMSIVPVLVALGSDYYLGELVTHKRFAGLFFGFFGILVVILQPFETMVRVDLNEITGSLIVVLAVVCNTFYLFLSRKLRTITNPLQLTGGTILSSFIGFGLLTLVSFAQGQDLVARTVGPTHLISLVILGTTGTLGIFFSSQYGLSRVNVLFASFGQYIRLPLAIIFGVVFYSDSLTASFVVGAVLITLGSILTARVSSKDTV